MRCAWAVRGQCLRCACAVAQVDGGKHTVTWQLPQDGWPVAGGATGSVLALFLLSLDEGVVWPALRRVQARIHLTGKAGAQRPMHTEYVIYSSTPAAVQAAIYNVFLGHAGYICPARHVS